MLKVSGKFIPNMGWHFTSDLGQICFGMCATTNPDVRFSDKELSDFCFNTQKFLAAISKMKFRPRASMGPLSMQEDRDRLDSCIYKYVKESDWNSYYKKGSIKIDRLERYTSQEYGEGPNDIWEGFGTCVAWDGERETIISYTVNPPIHIFCATNNELPSNEMHERYGNALIKISNPDRFFYLVAQKTDSKFYKYRSINYNNAKAFRFEHPFFSTRFTSFIQSDFFDGNRHLLTSRRRVFELIHRMALDVSTYCKPEVVFSEATGEEKCYAFEREVRAAFLTSPDRTNPLVTGECDEIASLISRIV